MTRSFDYKKRMFIAQIGLFGVGSLAAAAYVFFSDSMPDPGAGLVRVLIALDIPILILGLTSIAWIIAVWKRGPIKLTDQSLTVPTSGLLGPRVVTLSDVQSLRVTSSFGNSLLLLRTQDGTSTRIPLGDIERAPELLVALADVTGVRIDGLPTG